MQTIKYKGKEMYWSKEVENYFSLLNAHLGALQELQERVVEIITGKKKENMEMKSTDWIKVEDWIPTKDKMLILYHAFGDVNITIATHVDSLFFIDNNGRVLAPTHVMSFALPKED